MDDGVSIEDLGLDRLVEREWLIANHLGSYSSSTVPGLNTRKYHGLLVASMLPPARRWVILSRVEESVVSEEGHADLASNEYPGAIYPHGHELLRAFNVEPHPRWAYQAGRWTLEKHLRLLQESNTVVLTYILLGTDAPVTLELRPLFSLRAMHDLSFQSNARRVVEIRSSGHYRLPASHRSPEVFFAAQGRLHEGACWYLNTIYRREQERGYAGLEDVWSPGMIEIALKPGVPTHFACSTEELDLDRAVQRARAQTAAVTSTLTLVHTPPISSIERDLDTLRRAVEAVLLSLPGDGTSAPAGCVAGYPWSAPSLRHTLMGFGGLYLCSGRAAEGKALLLRLPSLLKKGQLPSEISEQSVEPVYRGPDVALWFIHAVDRFCRHGGDLELGRQLMGTMLQIVSAYRFELFPQIRVDDEGLLSCDLGAAPSSWMNAVTGDAAVTPRAGRQVELNALWYNALCTVVSLANELGDERAASLIPLAQSVHRAFNLRFWNAALGCCFDVVADSGTDGSVRPNQLLAMSLPHPVLRLDRHERTLEVIERELLTPYGLRSLSPLDRAYAGRYLGHVTARDRAYHNGSVFPWLLAPYLTAKLRVQGRSLTARQQARARLSACLDYMRGPGMGHLCELFDGETPHRPGGAVSSPLNMAELFGCVSDLVSDTTTPTIHLPTLVTTA